MFLKPLEEKKTNKFLEFIKNYPVVIIAAVFVVVILAGVLLYGRSSGDAGTEDGNTGSSDSKYVKTDTVLLGTHLIESLNPLKSTDSDTMQITQMVYSSLFTLDKNLNIVGDLVESYTTDPDAGTCELTLRSGVKFSDGTTLDEADVAYTVSQIKSIGEEGPYYVYANRIDRVSGSGTTVTIHFKDAADASLDNLVFPIVSRGGYNTSDTFQPMGSGAYQISSMNSNFSEIKLVPNPNYYGEAAKSKVTFSQFTYDGNLTGLVSEGKITAYVNTNDLNAKQNAEDLGLNATYLRSNQCEYLGFKYDGVTRQRKVRQAICYALDTEKLVEDSYGSSAMMSDSIYFPGFLGTKNKKDAYPYNLTKAQELLESAGYSDRNEDGKIENGNDEPVVLKLLVNAENSRRVDCAQEIAEHLATVGITVEIDKKCGDDYASALETKDFDLLLAGYQFDKTYNLKEMFDKENCLGYTNEVVKRETAELEHSLTAEEQTKAFERLKKTLNEDVPYYCICYKRWVFVSSDGLDSHQGPRFFNWYNGISTWEWEKVVTPDTASDTYENKSK